jgi:hypothetical protein
LIIFDLYFSFWILLVFFSCFGRKNQKCFVCLFPLKAFTRRVAEFGDKNYPKACLRGVFIRKVREARSAKAFKGVFVCFFSNIKDHGKSSANKLQFEAEEEMDVGAGLCAGMSGRPLTLVQGLAQAQIERKDLQRLPFETQIRTTA